MDRSLGDPRWRKGVCGCFCFVALSLLCHAPFRAWQLRHTYDLYMSGGKPRRDLLYNEELLTAHREAVRRWIRSDFLDVSSLNDPRARQLPSQMTLLSRLAQREDLEILWQRAEVGFPIGSLPPSQVFPDERELQRRQAILCGELVLRLQEVCVAVAGNEEDGLKAFREALQQRKIAPEVRRACGEAPAPRAARTERAATDTAP